MNCPEIIKRMRAIRRRRATMRRLMLEGFVEVRWSLGQISRQLRSASTEHELTAEDWFTIYEKTRDAREILERVEEYAEQLAMPHTHKTDLAR